MCWQPACLTKIIDDAITHANLSNLNSLLGIWCHATVYEELVAKLSRPHRRLLPRLTPRTLSQLSLSHIAGRPAAITPQRKANWPPSASITVIFSYGNTVPQPDSYDCPVSPAALKDRCDCTAWGGSPPQIKRLLSVDPPWDRATRQDFLSSVSTLSRLAGPRGDRGEHDSRENKSCSGGKIRARRTSVGKPCWIRERYLVKITDRRRITTIGRSTFPRKREEEDDK
ncbi:hypothetical protein J6590_023888 [Homalodisca vitripennis]|nr:hypothetical protein J6590_023888 [Homalodisca vitripennis]